MLINHSIIHDWFDYSWLKFSNTMNVHIYEFKEQKTKNPKKYI